MEPGTRSDVELIPIRELNAAELEPLVRCSADEGYNHVARLRDDYVAGRNRFDQAGELLLGAYDQGRLVAVGGLNRDPFAAAAAAAAGFGEVAGAGGGFGAVGAGGGGAAADFDSGGTVGVVGGGSTVGDVFDDEVAADVGDEGLVEETGCDGKVGDVDDDGMVAVAGGVGRLRRMYVMPDYRRCGIGGRIVRRLLEEARGAGVFQTVVLRSTGSAETDAFYHALGFQRAAEGEAAYTHYMRMR